MGMVFQCFQMAGYKYETNALLCVDRNLQMMQESVEVLRRELHAANRHAKRLEQQVGKYAAPSPASDP